eukprot:Anaeramoba_ignava/a615604_9.p1 GENE.a615604_9~~a615604_9.p1  ORF type:complete len:192 (-),score=55.21 a615604_9:500-1075(-)
MFERIISFSLIFIPRFPIAGLTCVVGLASYLVAHKLSLIHIFRRPHLYNDAIHRAILRVFQLMIVGLAISSLILNEESQTVNENSKLEQKKLYQRPSIYAVTIVIFVYFLRGIFLAVLSKICWRKKKQKAQLKEMIKLEDNKSNERDELKYRYQYPVEIPFEDLQFLESPYQAFDQENPQINQNPQEIELK